MVWVLRFPICSWILSFITESLVLKEKDVIREVNGFLPNSNCELFMEDQYIGDDYINGLLYFWVIEYLYFRECNSKFLVA